MLPERASANGCDCAAKTAGVAPAGDHALFDLVDAALVTPMRSAICCWVGPRARRSSARRIPNILVEQFLLASLDCLLPTCTLNVLGTECPSSGRSSSWLFTYRSSG